VDLGTLTIPSFSVLSVFSMVVLRTSEWPGVPIMLVARQPTHRETLRHNAIKRWVPCFEDLDAAFGALGRPPVRHRRMIRLAGHLGSSAEARRYVRDAAEKWGFGGMTDVVEDAQLIATELVENTVRHTASDLTLRLELRNGLLTVAVGDDDPRSAVLRERGENLVSSGLIVVAKLAKVWGCTPVIPGGKIVWAVLKAEPPPSCHPG